MSTTIGAVLAAIAAVFATFGFILFGKPKGSEGSSNSTPIEQVRPSVLPETVPNREETAVMPNVEISETLPPPSDSAIDPWNEEQIALIPEGASDALTLETVEQPELETELEQSERELADSEEEPTELNLDDANQVMEPVETQAFRSVPAIRYNSSNPAPIATIQQVPFAVIQDPQRPESQELQELSQKILAWGVSGTVEDLKTVMSYGKHPDPLIRRYVAVAIGQVATAGAIGDEVKAAVPVLEALSQDSDTKVQKMAAKSLRVIQGR
jgi:hypothetical protein